MAYLSEDIIKKRGVSYLKSYYRLRDRTGSGKTQTQFDVMTEGGIIADGHLSFLAKNDEPFTATLEATSFDTIDELKYKLQSNILAWDSFAVGSLITAFVFSYSYAFDQFTIHKIGLIPSVILLVGIFILATAAYYFSFRWMQRYRYIYAIEQFKKYHADEQWIAIGENIFNGPEDKYMKELKAQCVMNGFGLISIDYNLEPQLLITPSRREVFGQKRARLSFDERDAFLKRGPIARLKNMGSTIAGKLPGFGKSIFKKEGLGRYKKSHFSQILLSLFSMALLGGIFYTQMQDSPIVYVDEKTYVDSMEQLALNTFPEYEEVSIDTPWVEPFKKEEGYLALEGEKNTPPDDIEAEDWDDIIFSPLLGEDLVEIDAAPRGDNNQIILSTGTGEVNTYDCTRLRNMHGTFYLVQDNIFSSFAAAEKHIKRMNKKGIPLNAFSLACLDSGNQQYVVHYDLFCATKAEAKEAQVAYRKLLAKKGMKKKKPSIKSLQFK